MAKATAKKSSGNTALQAELMEVEEQLALAEAQYLLRILKESSEVSPENDAGWELVSSGGRFVEAKDISGVGIETDLSRLRKQSARSYRLDPHGRAVIRNVAKFTAARSVALDFGDTTRGVWANRVRSHVQVTGRGNDPLLVRLVWEDFAKINRWGQRFKELVRRTLRDGEVFLRGFRRNGRVFVRFIEPEYVGTPLGVTSGRVLEDDIPDGSYELTSSIVGEPTLLRDGIEVLAEDVETPVAYHVRRSGNSTDYDRIPAKEVIHLKCGVDLNDARGLPHLEPILKKLSQYDTWEEYRVILNKVRTAIALVRKVEGTASQAASIIAGRQPAASSPSGRDPQTTSGRREATFRPGTVLTPSAGVTYDFISPRLDARDAGEDGRRLLLTIAAGAGQPEMLITSDFSNSNFASTSVAAQLVQREWEDWQDIFSPVITAVYEWVIAEAVAGLGLPGDTDASVVIHWPPFLKQDEGQATIRREKLWRAGILSRRTWATEEGYILDDELENMDDDDDPKPPPPNAGGAASFTGPGPGAPKGQTRAARVLGQQRAMSESQDGAAALAEGMRVQSLVFDLQHFTLAKARRWARGHGFKSSKSDMTDTSIRLRQADPSRFSDGSFRTITLKPGVQAVVAKPGAKK